MVYIACHIIWVFFFQRRCVQGDPSLVFGFPGDIRMILIKFVRVKEVNKSQAMRWKRTFIQTRIVFTFKALELRNLIKIPFNAEVCPKKSKWGPNPFLRCFILWHCFKKLQTEYRTVVTKAFPWFLVELFKQIFAYFVPCTSSICKYLFILSKVYLMLLGHLRGFPQITKVISNGPFRPLSVNIIRFRYNAPN